MNSINWPASIVWVFIAQLVEHCSANAEATDSLKPRKTFFRDTSQLRKLRFNCDGHIFISDCFFLLTRHVHYREDKEVIIILSIGFMLLFFPFSCVCFCCHYLKFLLFFFSVTSMDSSPNAQGNSNSPYVNAVVR